MSELSLILGGEGRARTRAGRSRECLARADRETTRTGGADKKVADEADEEAEASPRRRGSAAAEAEVRGRHRERRPQESGEGMGRWWEPRLGGRASSRAARVCG